MVRENSTAPYEALQSFVVKTGAQVLNEGLRPGFSEQESEQILRRVDLAVQYHENGTTIKELGQKFAIGERQTGILVREGVAFLVDEFPHEGGMIFDGTALPKKPLTVASHRRISDAHGGITGDVQESMEEGLGPRDLAKKYGRRLTTARRALRSQNTEVPYVRKPAKKVREILGNLEELRDYEGADKYARISKAMGEVTRQIYHKYRGSGLFATISRLATAAGLQTPRNKGDMEQFIRVLIWSGIPSRGFSYESGGRKHKINIVFTGYAKDAVHAFRIAPELEGYRKIGALKASPR